MIFGKNILALVLVVTLLGILCGCNGAANSEAGGPPIAVTTTTSPTVTTTTTVTTTEVAATTTEVTTTATEAPTTEVTATTTTAAAMTTTRKPATTTTKKPAVTTKKPVTTTTKKPVVTTTTTKPTTAPVDPFQPDGVHNEVEMEIFRLLNAERTKNGLPPLALATQYHKLAEIRAKEIIESFSHTRPDGTSCFSVLGDDWGTTVFAAAENIAMGYRDAASVHLGWKNSEGHYRNMMSTSVNAIAIAVAYTDEGTPYYCQFFVKIL